jgi:hypothetical protein
MRIFYIFFKNYFAKLYDGLKIYTFHIHSSWPMAAAVAHGGFSTYRRAPRRLGCRRGVRSGPQRLHVAYRRGP